MAQKGQWQVAGSAPEVYERELVPAVFGPWAPILIDLAQPRPGERVVDIACGTGIVARSAAVKVGPTGIVAGVDLNPGMLMVARSLTTTDDAAAVQWHEASRTACRCRTVRSISRTASSACNSSPTGRLHCAKYAGFCLHQAGSRSWCGAE